MVDQEKYSSFLRFLQTFFLNSEHSSEPMFWYHCVFLANRTYISYSIVSFINPYACMLVLSVSGRRAFFVNSVVRQLMKDTWYSSFQVCRRLSNYSAFEATSVSGKYDICCLHLLKPLGANILLCVSKYGKLFEKYHCPLYKRFLNQMCFKQCSVQYGNIVIH